MTYFTKSKLCFFISSAIILHFGLIVNKAYCQNLSITPGNDTMLCTNQTLQLTANFPASVSVQLPPGTSIGYESQSIPNSPIIPGGTNVPLTDDSYGGPYPIGFNFTYYGQTYSQFYISANGWIGFTAPLTGYFNMDLPTMDANPCATNYPYNGIYGVLFDFNPLGDGNRIKYQTVGTAPNRTLVVSYESIAFFTTSCGGSSTFQIQLHETTNVVEVHITSKPSCTQWASSIRSGLAPPIGNPCPGPSTSCPLWGYTGPDIALNNVAWRYTPAMPGTAVMATFGSLQWTMNGNTGGINPNNAATTITAWMPSSTSPPRRYVATATYNIPCGGTLIYKDTVIITPRPFNATFTVTSPVCMGAEASIFTFTGGPTPTASATVAWNFGGGVAVPGTGIGPHNVTWATPGTKNVSLNLSSAVCAPGNYATTVLVVPSPTSTFTATPTVCGTAPSIITYTGNAPPTATFNWNFNGGTPSPAGGSIPQSVSWNTPGLKTIQLTVSIGSCVSQVSTFNVNVLPPPSSAFTVSQNSVCAGSPVTLTYTGSASASSAYTWNVDGGIATPANGQGPISVNWSSAGIKNVSLQINDAGCISTLTTIPVTVYQIPTATFTVGAGVCPNQNANIFYTGNASSSASFNWNWNGGNANPSSGIGPFNVNWSTAGNKTITLTVSENGCSSSAINQYITVYPIPTSNFSASPAGVCVGGNVNISYQGTATPTANYTWNFSGGAALPGGNSAGPHSVNWSTSGTQTISLTVTENGCQSLPFNQQITIYSTPSANFNATDSVCPNANAQIDYVGSGSNAVVLAWNFNGGIGNVGTNPSDPFNINWSTSGNKTITLTATENGCTSLPFIQNVLVYNTPSSSFTAISPVCENAPSLVTYLGGSSSSATYNWSINSAVTPNPLGQGPHNSTWTTAGSYFLNLTVVENGCTSLPTQIQVTVNPIPTGNFTSTGPVCLNTNATILYTGSASASSTFNWNFDGGSPNITYGPGPLIVNWPTVGIKNVSLTVSALGCVSPIFTLPVNVLSLPIVNAGIDREVCSGALSNLGSSSVAGLLYNWLPTDGLVSPNQAVTDIQIFNATNFTQIKEYVLRANDGSCFAFDTVLYYVTAPPSISFTLPAGQCFEGNSFNFYAQGAFTPSATFNWNLGPNTYSIATNDSVISNVNFNAVGSQTISLQVDDSGCLSNVFTSDVLVYPEPIADFTAEVIEGCAPIAVNFINQSSGDDNLLYSWNFGAGSPSNSETPKFLYEIPGIYDVSLNVSTVNGCTNSMDKKNYIRVYQVPEAGFAINKEKTTIVEPNILINSNTLINDSLEVTFTINPGDVIFNDDTVSYNLPDTGTYIITQFLRNGFGCADTAYKTIKVNTGYRVYIPNSFSPNNDGLNDVFTVYGEDIRKFKITIFNRWGEQLYQSFDLKNGWDGTVKLTDRKVPLGVYLYVIETTDDLGFIHKQEGLVNVIL
jgi:gliding motility-associated-like protein